MTLPPPSTQPRPAARAEQTRKDQTRTEETGDHGGPAHEQKAGPADAPGNRPPPEAEVANAKAGGLRGAPSPVGENDLA
ncbi:hypothetical protein [Aquabacter spiritensis]|uniref:Uncharacterized protein n=1 Tax=Aquabacter spiritensis TaxID=933073 RepID=A0A4R3LNV0_9HYPH|nr:hypothetical protein [Aquabacter spiritensis]TCT02143.1 hypothetical protein EDC64_1142 [Aquabacter spiritensis]